MGKRGRPRKQKPAPVTPSKAEQCYTLLSSDDETSKKDNQVSLRLPPASQRRGAGSERGGLIAITPPDRSPAAEKTTPVTRANGQKKIKLNGLRKKEESSGDSDATEVYVHGFAWGIQIRCIEGLFAGIR